MTDVPKAIRTLGMPLTMEMYENPVMSTPRMISTAATDLAVVENLRLTVVAYPTPAKMVA